MGGKGLHELPWDSELCNYSSPLKAFSQATSSPCPQTPKLLEVPGGLRETLGPNRGTGTHGTNTVTLPVANKP